jgi:predicted nucleotide-binding protein
MSLAAIVKKLNELILDADHATSIGSYEVWGQRVFEFLSRALDSRTAGEFSNMYRRADEWPAARGRQLGMLEAIAASQDDGSVELSSVPSAAMAAPISKRVFVVHGHDHGAKETVARYLERLGLEAVILHEKPSESRTVIEKIEAFSDVGFAVVLLTPDDVGAAKADAASLKPRARQNVVLELGYFIGKLRRSRVCALYTPGVEIPSDYSGVLFIELDAKGAWRTLLAQELSNARLPINVAGLLGS